MEMNEYVLDEISTTISNEEQPALELTYDGMNDIFTGIVNNDNSGDIYQNFETLFQRSSLTEPPVEEEVGSQGNNEVEEVHFIKEVKSVRVYQSAKIRSLQKKVLALRTKNKQMTLGFLVSFILMLIVVIILSCLIANKSKENKLLIESTNQLNKSIQFLHNQLDNLKEEIKQNETIVKNKIRCCVSEEDEKTIHSSEKQNNTWKNTLSQQQQELNCQCYSICTRNNDLSPPVPTNSFQTAINKTLSLATCLCFKTPFAILFMQHYSLINDYFISNNNPIQIKIHLQFQIKSVFIENISPSLNVAECFIRCSNKDNDNGFGKTKVLQIRVYNNNSSLTLCYCSKITSHYLQMFPHRYLEESKSMTFNDQVYVVVADDNDDVSTDNTNKLPLKPLLFYPLDDVSKGRTEGILSNQSIFGVTFQPKPPEFTCSLFSDRKRKYLQLHPLQQPHYEILHNNSIKLNENYNDFTVMFWFKKSQPDLLVGPIIESVTANYIQWHWSISIYPTKNDIFFENRDISIKYMGIAPYSIDNWSHVAVTLHRNQANFFINGTNFLRENVNNVMSFGHTLTIGNRLIPNDGHYGRIFYGCVAHLMVFNKSLTQNEIHSFKSLLFDKDF